MRMIVGVLCVLLAWPVLAMATFRVHPRIDLRTEYNDNLFLDPNREQDDLITTLAPGLRLDYSATQLTLGADYSLRFKKYSDHSELDETRLRDVQRASLLADLFPGRDFTLHLADTLSRVSLDERLAVSADNDFRNKSNLNSLLVNPSYTFRKIQHFSATLGYAYARSDYEAAAGDDWENHAGSLDLTKDLTADLALLAGGSQRFHQAERTENYHRLDYYGGLRLQLSPKISLHGRVGQIHISPENRPDSNSLLFSAGGDYEYSSHLTLSGLAAQDYANSPTNGLFRRRTLSGTLAYKGKFTLDLGAQAQIGEYLEFNREDRSAGLRGAFGLPLSPRTSLGFGGDVTYFKFLPEDEVVYRYGANLSLSYRYDILLLRASYSHRVNDSTFASNDYRNNIVAGEVGLHF